MRKRGSDGKFHQRKKTLTWKLCIDRLSKMTTMMRVFPMPVIRASRKKVPGPTTDMNFSKEVRTGSTGSLNQAEGVSLVGKDEGAKEGEEEEPSSSTTAPAVETPPSASS